ncbi:hypothetical protein EPN16_07240 [bacterium]|nr:MAG: hypothetical protein EPN16_07240 [bacterium]
MAIRYPLSAKRGITLIELLIAISLVGMIVLAIVAVDVASRRFVNTSDFEARAQNQIAPTLDMIAKDVSLAIGNVRADSGICKDSDPTPCNITTSVVSQNIRSRIDRNSNPTPGNYSDDTWVGYRYNSTGSIIQRRECASNTWATCPTNWDTIATSIVDPTNFTISLDGSVRMVISARLPERDSTAVTLETTVFPRGNSAN